MSVSASPAAARPADVVAGSVVARAHQLVAPGTPAAQMRAIAGQRSVQAMVAGLTHRTAPARAPALRTASWRAAVEYLSSEARRADAGLGGDYARRAQALARANRGCAGPRTAQRARMAQPQAVRGCTDAALQRRATAAALRLARAIDRVLPTLRAQAGATRGRDAAVGCDLVDQAPVLCVGSEASNVYTKDAMVNVDLGGDDTYLNTAGGAPFEASDSDVVPISVSLDLAGDDTYRSSHWAYQPVAKYRAAVAQGATYYGGAAGILVDAAGNDTYDLTAPPTPPADNGVKTELSMVGQGASYGTGIGLLVDQAGNDRRTTRWTAGSQFGWVTAQGSAFLGAAASIDQGAGDDAYAIDSGPVRDAGTVYLQGQGAAQNGEGLLSDDGGADAFDLKGSADVPDRALAGAPAIQGTSFTFCPGLPGICVAAQGWAGQPGSTGALLEGTGDSRYSIALTGTGLTRFLSSSGQGQALSDSHGVLWDRGGNDAYDEATTLSSDQAIPAGGPTAYDLSGISSGIRAQGADNGGLLVDQGAGDDRYRSATTESAKAAFAAAAGAKAVGFGAPVITGQGAAGGTLLDDGGTDRYSAAGATTASGGGTGVRVDALGRPGIQAQGAGGTLVDEGGAGDTFDARSTTTALAPVADDARALVMPSLAYRLSSHGYPNGTFVAQGDRPSVFSSPSVPVCATGSDPGSIGFGRWRSVCSGHEVFNGYAPSATGAGGTLTLDKPDGYHAAANAGVAVAAKLVDEAGHPVAGKPLHLTLAADSTPKVIGPLDMGQINASSGGLWNGTWGQDFWQADGVTGADGVARVTVPTWVNTRYGDLPLTAGYAITATYDGEAGPPARRPQFASAAFKFDREPVQ